VEEVIRADKIRAEEIRFLWGNFPRGMLTLIAGRPGEGKSMFTAYLAAEVTKQRDGYVLFSNMEDPLPQVVRPRLEAAGARLERILFWTPFLPKQIADLEEIIREHKIKLIVLDPIAAHLSVSIYNDQEARAALSPFSALLARTSCACVAVHHTVKNSSAAGHPLRAVGGSGGGLPGAARAVFIWGVNPVDADERVLVPIKFNIAEMPKTAHFEMDDEEVVIGRGKKAKLMQTGRLLYMAQNTISVDAWNVINHGQAGTPGTNVDKRAEAAEWLTHYLALGKRPAKEIKEDSAQYGLSWRTIRRAAEAIEIVITRQGFGAGGKSYWELPPGHPALLVSGDEEEPDAA